MEFQKCSVNGVIYGEGVTEAQRGAATRDGNTAEMLNPEKLNEKLASLKQWMISIVVQGLVSATRVADFGRTKIGTGFKAGFLASESAYLERDPCYLEYKAESPDEAALVAAARDVGFPFINKWKDGKERYKVLKVLEFNSNPKPNGVLLCGTPRVNLSYSPREQTVSRDLEEEEYLGWARRYDAAVNAVEGRDEEIERNKLQTVIEIGYNL
ncbi:hypothetical protein EV368DRAFT_68412 [Lentinula lateritia]|nr:hypothetical protein EV368DRAFT_68412 [Lentinula lateritia]